jgi:hypothetical protein
MFASVTYTGNGSNRVFSVPFGYLDSSDVVVDVNGVPVVFTYLTASTVQLAVAPANGATVKVSRSTAVAGPDIAFIDNANLTARDLNRATRQTFYSLQELRDDHAFWVNWIQDQTISGGDLPPIAPSDDGSFLVADSSTWQVKSLDDVKTILGLDDTIATIYPLPAPAGYPALAYTDGNSGYTLLGITATRDFLNLGTLALHAVGDYHVLSLNPEVDNTSTGSLVILVDVGGTPGLPPVSGANLTDLPVPLYVRVDQTAAYNVDAGAYPVAATWVARSFTTIVTDEVGGISLSSGWAEIPAGKYEFRARTKMRVAGAMACRLVLESGSTVQTGTSIWGQGEEQFIEVSGQFTIGADDGLKVEVYSTNNNAAVNALGTAHADAALGINRYTVLHLWKLP